MSSTDHILLTRFNLPSEGMESGIRVRPGWLEDRVGLFERYCLPSVRAQRGSQLKWIIYFDPESPTWLKEWIDQTCEDTYMPVFRAQVDRSELLADLNRITPTKSETLITSNLDNDDGLALTFGEILQSLPAGPDRAVYLAQGLIKSPTGLYLHTDRDNAFCSVVETWDDPKTCWSDWHNRLHLHMPVEVVSGPPQWLQVVHTTNVSNRVRGRLVSPDAYLADFVGIEDALRPSSRDLRRDRLVSAPGRALRVGLRSSARKTAVRLLGKDGVSTLKARVMLPKSARSTTSSIGSGDQK